MHLVVTVAVLVAVVVAAAGLCRRFDLSAPLVLVAVGMVASFVPWIPEVELTAELALVGFLPPLLYSAALQTSLVDFNANRRPILLLSIGLVRLHHRGRRRRGARGAAGRRLACGVRPRCRRGAARTRWPPPPSPAGSGCRAGSSPSSRASRCSTTPPPWSRCAPPSSRSVVPSPWSTSAWTSSAPRSGAWRSASLVFVAGRLAAQAAHRARARLQRLVRDALRGVRRRRGDPRVGRPRRRGGRPDCWATRRR